MPMSFENYWQRIVKANPKILNPGIFKMPTDTLKRQLEKAYNAGAQDTVAAQKAAGDFKTVNNNSMPEIFREIFEKQ